MALNAAIAFGSYRDVFIYYLSLLGGTCVCLRVAPEALTDAVGALHSQFFLMGQENRGVTFEHCFLK